MASAMAKPKIQRKLSRQSHENQKPKPPSWAVVKGIFSCKYLQPQQQQQQQHHQLPRKEKQQEQATEEISKNCKKMRCSGSLCSNTKITHRLEAAASPEVHKKRVLTSRNNESSSSSRSSKAPPLNEQTVSATCSSLSASSSSSNSSNGASSFRGMPFRRFYGCYECKMVIDPVIGMTRDPSLRATICPCPECGEIFMKPETLELRAHAGLEKGGGMLSFQTPICPPTVLPEKWPPRGIKVFPKSVQCYVKY